MDDLPAEWSVALPRVNWKQVLQLIHEDKSSDCTSLEDRSVSKDRTVQLSHFFQPGEFLDELPHGNLSFGIDFGLGKGNYSPILHHAGQRHANIGLVGCHIQQVVVVAELIAKCFYLLIAISDYPLTSLNDIIVGHFDRYALH